MSARVSASTRERREPFRDPLAVDGCPSAVGRQHGERFVELAPRHRLRSPTVAQPARLFAHELERVCDTGKAALVGERLSRPIPGTHWRERSGARPDCRYRRKIYIGGSSGRRSRVSYQL